MCFRPIILRQDVIATQQRFHQTHGLQTSQYLREREVSVTRVPAVLVVERDWGGRDNEATLLSPFQSRERASRPTLTVNSKSRPLVRRPTTFWRRIEPRHGRTDKA